MRTARFVASICLAALLANAASAQTTAPKKPKPEYPPHADVLKGYEKVVTTASGKSMYTLWKKEKSGDMLAELPRTFSSKKYFFAMTVGAGDRYAGLQSGDRYVYWRKFGKRLALIEPNLGVRADGESGAKSIGQTVVHGSNCARYEHPDNGAWWRSCYRFG